MKKSLSIFLVFSLMFVTLFFSFGATVNVKAASDIQVSINGELQHFSQPPVVISGSTLVPMRAIFEVLGASISWNSKEHSVTATKDNTTIYIKIGDSQATVDGKQVDLSVPAQIVSGYTMVPLRFVSEALGAKVNWDGTTKTVIITLDTTKKSVARKLLEEGLAEEGMSIDNFTFQLLSDSNDFAEKGNNLLVDMWKQQLGINVNIDSAGFTDKLDRLGKQDFDVGYAGWGPDYNDPLTWMLLFETDGQYNAGKYSNPQYDSLVEKAKTELDPEKRLDDFLEAEKILVKDDVGIAPIDYRYYGYLLNPNVKGIIVKGMGPELELKWASKELPDTKMLQPGEVKKQELNLFLPIMPNLDTQTSQSWVVTALEEGLVRIGPSGVAPGMAESWKISDDGKTYTFKIRNNAQWSNNAPVTAQDFVYGWERAINAQTDSNNYSIITDYIKGAKDYYNYTLYKKLKGLYDNDPITFEDLYQSKTPSEVVYGIKTNPQPVSFSQVGIKAVNNQTLEVTLTQPTPWFLELTTYPTYMPLNKAFYEKHVDDYATNTDKLLYNGPWTLTNINDNVTELVLSKNDTYWDKNNVALDNIYIDLTYSFSIPSYKYSYYDYLPFTYNDSLVNINNAEFQPHSEFVTFYLEFNQTKKPFNNQKVRKALSMAIDREMFTKIMTGNLFKPAYGLVPPGFKAYATTTKTFRDASMEKYGQLFSDLPFENK